MQFDTEELAAQVTALRIYTTAIHHMLLRHAPTEGMPKMRAATLESCLADARSLEFPGIKPVELKVFKARVESILISLLPVQQAPPS
jgi:hypothetical protein